MNTLFHTSLHRVTFAVVDGSAKTAARTQTGLTVSGDMPTGAAGPALAARRAP